MGESRGTREVLYYPYAHADEAWLKRALLGWDSVSVVRPAGVERVARPLGPVEAKIHDQLPGFFTPLTPIDDELRPITRALDGLLGDPELQLRYGRLAREALEVPGAPRSQAAPERGDPRLVWLYAGPHDTKIAYSVAAELERLDLAEVIGEFGASPWIGLHPEFAAIYMTAVASQMAGRRALTPYTDDVRVHRAAGAGDLYDLDLRLTGQSRTGRFETDDKVGLRVVEDHYLHVALTAAVDPVDIDEVPVEALIDFRGEHADELRAYREHLATFEDDLLNLIAVDEELREAKLRKIYVEKTEPIIQGVNRRLTKAGFRTALKSMAIKIAPDAVAGTALGALTNEIVSATGTGDPGRVAISAAVGAVPLIAGIRRDREDIREPVAYLLAATKDLQPDKLLAYVAMR